MNAPGVMYAALAGDYDENNNGAVDGFERNPADKGVYRSDDRGNTWVKVNNGLNLAANPRLLIDSFRIVLTPAVSPILGAPVPVIYASTIDLNRRLTGVFKSVTGGGVLGTFFVPLPPVPADVLPNQGSNHFSLGVNPDDANDVYVGGTFSAAGGVGNIVRFNPAISGAWLRW